MKNLDYTLRSSLSFYCITGVIFTFMFGVGIFDVFYRTYDAWPIPAISAFLLASAMSVLLSTKLALSEDSIHYRSLFIQRDLPLKDVVGVKFVAGFSSTKPYQRLIVTIRGRTDQSEIIINLGLFDRGEIKRWIDALNAKLLEKRVL